MSQRTLPLLFFNLGGEMLYILHQRLHAQNVLTAKAAKVMEDMVTTMFGEEWVEELFRPQPLFSREGLKVLFLKVAHSSVMRLSNVAMEKLYDLMSMSFKYQLLACPRPEDIILITLNHLDSLKNLVAESHTCCDMIHIACRKLNEHYSSLSKATFITLRSTMLTLFQDSHKRISVLLRQKLQHQNGALIIPVGGPIPVGMEIPGTLRYYSEDGVVSHTDHFSHPDYYTPSTRQGSWETTGDRVTTLGLNIYTRDCSSQTKARSVSHTVLVNPTKRVESEVKGHKKLDEEDEWEVPEGGGLDVHHLATNVEIALLQRLLVTPHRNTTFKLNLFPELDLDDDTNPSTSGSNSHTDTEQSTKPKENILQLETHQRGTKELNDIKDHLTLEDTGSNAAGDDLLDLMDQAIAS